MANYVCIGGCGQQVSAKGKRCRKCAGRLRRKRPGGGPPVPASDLAGQGRVRPAAPSGATGEPIPAGNWVTVKLRRDDAAELSRLADLLGAQRVATAAKAREASADEIRKMAARAGQLLSAATALRAALTE